MWHSQPSNCLVILAIGSSNRSSFILSTMTSVVTLPDTHSDLATLKVIEYVVVEKGFTVSYTVQKCYIQRLGKPAGG